MLSFPKIFKFNGFEFNLEPNVLNLRTIPKFYSKIIVSKLNENQTLT